MSEAITPDAGNGATGAAPETEQSLMGQLGEILGDEEEADPAEGDNADADPQGDPKPDEGEAEPEAKAEEDAGPEDGESDKEEPAAKIAADTDTVEIDGKSVPVAELKQGYLREADYTRKTQAIARERGEMDSAVSRLEAFDNQTRQRLDLADAILRTVIPPPPDPALMHTDMPAYMLAKEQREAVLNVVAQIEQAQKHSVEAKQTQAVQQSQQAIKAEVEDLRKRLPEFSDVSKIAEFQKEAVELGAKHYGLSEGEVLSIRSAKELHVLRDAIAFRKLQAKQEVAKAKVVAAPPLTKPGTRAPKSGDRLERLRTLGSNSNPDGAAILAEMDRQGLL